MANVAVNGILLPPDLVWEEEFGWSPMGLTKKTSITGALLIQTSKKRTGGRPLTLKSGSDFAMLTRAQLEDLYALCDTTPPVPFPLLLGDGRTFTVLFDTSEGSPPIEATPIQPGKEPAPGDLFQATLRFLETA